MKQLKFSSDYSKLRDRVFTTIRASDDFGDEGDIVEVVSPSLPPFKAVILFKTETDFDQLSNALLCYDTEQPTRGQSLGLIKGLYDRPIERGFLYFLKRVDTVKWRKARKKSVTVQFREVNSEREEIHTMEGNLVAIRDKDFVIKGVDGEEYPINKEIFRKTYDVED